MLNKKLIVHILGISICIEAFLLLISSIVSLYFNEDSFSVFMKCGFLTFTIGGILTITTRKTEKIIGKREGYIIVSSIWVIFSLFGCLPYLFCIEGFSFTNAFFETISGFSTTGVSVISNVESLPFGLLFWRSFTQWIGGLGIIVFFLAFMPFLFRGGMQLFSAEMPGITHVKLYPKLRTTALKLFLTYLTFTIVESILLKFAGMSIFDAVCHAFTTMSTGGFSTKNTNIAYFNSPMIEYVIIIFMYLAGINYATVHYITTFKFSKVKKEEEFFHYNAIILFFSLIIGISLLTIYHSASTSFREALFQVTSIITTTGYITTDFSQWTPFALNLIFMMLFIGASTGSTGGGIKVLRIVILVKNAYYSILRVIHPRAVIPLRINKKSISPAIVSDITVFVIIYILIFVLGSLVLTFFNIDFMTAIGSTLTTLSNTGIGLGKAIHPTSYEMFPVAAKWILAFLMLVGRLEVFTILILIGRQVWKK